jgi:lysophospholipase L1-like esterase
MKRALLIVVVLFGILPLLYGQQEAKYTPLYYHRASLFENLPIEKSDIVFLGNSIIHYCEWAELLNNHHVKNRGISGDIAEGVYDRLDPIVKGQPKKIFLLIGVNNLSRNYSVDSILTVVGKIADKIALESPRTKLYIHSGFPVNDSFTNYPKHSSKGALIIEYNIGLEKLCKDRGLTFINVYPLLKCKDSEKLNPEYTRDGLHLTGEGYKVWKKLLMKYL